MINEYESKRMKMKKGAETVFIEIKNKMDVEMTEKILRETLTEESEA